mgnify:CR=1 FL=1
MSEEYCSESLLMVIELTIPANIELNEEEEKAFQNLFFAFSNARRICYSLRQKYELRGRISRSEIIKRVRELTGLNSRYVKEVT